MLISLFVLCTVISYPVIASYINRGHSIDKPSIEVSVEMLKPPAEETPPPPPPPPVDIKMPKFTVPIVVNEDVENTMESQDELSIRPTSPMTPDNGEISIQEQETPPVIEQPKPVEIFTVVEEQPYLNGLYEYLSQNIKYPEEAKELGIQGKVFVTFVVEKDGSITNVKVLRGIGGGCDEEAIRVVQNMPKWSPGKQRGQAVRVQFNLPVKFTLN
jgi:protein TonB